MNVVVFDNKLIKQALEHSAKVQESCSRSDVKLLSEETAQLVEQLKKAKLSSHEKGQKILSKQKQKESEEKENLDRKKQFNAAKFEEKLVSLKAERTQHEKVLQKEKSTLAEITSKKLNVLEDQKLLDKRKETLKEKETDSIVRSQAQFALLTTTCNVRWDYQSAVNEVKGCVSGKKDLIPFSIDQEERDKCYIANYIWDLIEATQ